MISNKSMRWIEVGKILAQDSERKVLCPNCEQNNLLVEDIRSELEPEVVERKMYCPTCGVKNYIRLKQPVLGK